MPKGAIPVALTGARELTPMDMLDRAIASGASVEVLEKLMGLQERWERNQERLAGIAARRAFDEALAAAQAEMPTITKNRSASFGPGKTAYQYEDLAEIVQTVDPILSKHGLRKSWVTSTPEGGRISVTCIIAHRAGHREENTLSAAADTSGSKNSIQAIGYSGDVLQRYTLKSALGLAAAVDDDGRAAGKDIGNGNGGTISEAQVAEIRTLVMQAAPLGSTTAIKIFETWLGIPSIEQMPVAKFEKARKGLLAKIGKKAATDA